MTKRWGIPVAEVPERLGGTHGRPLDQKKGGSKEGRKTRGKPIEKGAWASRECWAEGVIKKNSN